MTRTLVFKDRAAWRAWLEQHHATATEAWLVFGRAGAGRKLVGQRVAVEEALCFGWIDSQVRAVDAQTYRQRFTPRRARSVWSDSNKARVQKLVEQGLMTRWGMEAVEAARRNGSWDALDVTDAIPPELAAALRQNARARARFEKAPASTRKQFIWMVASAKKAETRARRVAIALKMLEANARFDINTRLGTYA